MQQQPAQPAMQRPMQQPMQQSLAGTRANPLHCRHCSVHHPLHHLQQHAGEYLHLQPPSQNLVHRQQQHQHHHPLHHSHHSRHQANSAIQTSQRLKQFSNYASLAVRQQQHNENQLNSSGQMQVLESAASPPSQLMCLNSFNKLQVNESPMEDPFARILQQPPIRPRIGSVSAVVQQSPSSPLATAAPSSSPFITRSTSFSSPRELYINSHSPIQSPVQQPPMLHQLEQPQHSYLTSNLSPSDALSLGINLEQYISKRNERERSRVRNVNDAFDHLKSSLPLDTDKLGKRMSKVEILRTAISYIRNLEQVLGHKEVGDQGDQSGCAREQQSPGQTPGQLCARYLSSDSSDSSESQRQQRVEQRNELSKPKDSACKSHLHTHSQRLTRSSPTSPSASSVCSSSAASPSSNEGVTYGRQQIAGEQQRVQQQLQHQQPFCSFNQHEHYANPQTAPNQSHFELLTLQQQQQQQLHQPAEQQHFSGFNLRQQAEEPMESQGCPASYAPMRNFELN